MVTGELKVSRVKRPVAGGWLHSTWSGGMAGRSPAITPGCFSEESSPVMGDDTVSRRVPRGHCLPHQAWGSSLRGSAVRTPDPGHALGPVCISGPAASAETSVGTEEALQRPFPGP